MKEFSHIDPSGEIRMVDISGKDVVRRTAVASGSVRMEPETIEMIRKGLLKKGDPVACAKIAGIMGAKRTSDLVPLCHPLRLNRVKVEVGLDAAHVDVRVEVHATDRTGVEMEAMTAAAVTALTVYDMCKALDRAMVIESVQLESKAGGKSGEFTRT